MEKEIFDTHRQLRRHLKQAKTAAETINARVQLAALANGWKARVTDQSGDPVNRQLARLVYVLKDYPELEYAAEKFLAKTNRVLADLNTLALRSMDISDRLNVSKHPLSENERQALAEEKVRLNHTIAANTKMIESKISQFYATLEVFLMKDI